MSQAEVSRTKGVAPLLVFFKAEPFKGSYVWDFGDPQAGNWPLWDGSNWVQGQGMPRNQTRGSRVAHVFQKPGTYSVKMNGKDVSQITVTDPDEVFAGERTICFCSDGKFEGAPAGAKKIEASMLRHVMEHMKPQTRLLLSGKFTGDVPLMLKGSGPGIVGSFGPNGAVIHSKAKGNAVSGNGANDWRLSDITFRADKQAKLSGIGGGRTCKDALFQNLKFGEGEFNKIMSWSGTTLDAMRAGLHERIGFMHVTGMKAGHGRGGLGAFVAIKGAAMMGCEMSSEGGEMVVRFQHGEDVFFAYNKIGPQGAEFGLKPCLTFRGRPFKEACSGGCGRCAGKATVAYNFINSGSPILINVGTRNKSNKPIQVADVEIFGNYGVGGKVFVDVKKEASGVSVAENYVAVKKDLAGRAALGKNFRGTDLQQQVVAAWSAGKPPPPPPQQPEDQPKEVEEAPDEDVIAADQSELEQEIIASEEEIKIAIELLDKRNVENEKAVAAIEGRIEQNDNIMNRLRELIS